MIPSWIWARGFSSCSGFPRSFSVRRGKYCQAAWRRQSNVVTDLNAAKKELQGAEKIKLSWGIYPSTVKHKSNSCFMFSSPLSSLLLNCGRNGVSVPSGESQKKPFWDFPNKEILCHVESSSSWEGFSPADLHTLKPLTPCAALSQPYINIWLEHTDPGKCELVCSHINVRTKKHTWLT